MHYNSNRLPDPVPELSFVHEDHDPEFAVEGPERFRNLSIRVGGGGLTEEEARALAEEFVRWLRSGRE